MPDRLRKVLSLLMVLAVAWAPLGNATASRHAESGVEQHSACAATAGQLAQHPGQGQQSTVQQQHCAHCNCGASSGTCSSHAGCGSSAAIASWQTGSKADRHGSVYLASPASLLISSRTSDHFRPPQA